MEQTKRSNWLDMLSYSQVSGKVWLKVLNQLYNKHSNKVFQMVWGLHWKLASCWDAWSKTFWPLYHQFVFLFINSALKVDYHKRSQLVDEVEGLIKEVEKFKKTSKQLLHSDKRHLPANKQASVDEILKIPLNGSTLLKELVDKCEILFRKNDISFN